MPGMELLPTDPVMQSPFLKNASSKASEMKSYVKIIKSILKLKYGDARAFEKFFGTDARTSKLIQSIYYCIVYRKVNNYLNLIMNLSNFVDLKIADKITKTKVVKKAGGRSRKVVEKEGKKIESSAKSLFLQFMYLLSGKKIHELF